MLKLMQRWFPGKSDKTYHTILWNLTAYPAGDAEIIERQIKWAAIRTMPELPGFAQRLDEAMDEICAKMDAAHEAAKTKVGIS
jgi:hypothetical protein